jgi:hypothetical protein
MKKSTIAFSALNFLGMLCLVFYVLSARQQAIMEGRDSYDAGDSFGFLLFVMPIVFLCLVGNIAWLVVAGVDIYRERNYRSAAAFVAVAVLWAAFVQLDRMVADLPSSQALSIGK